MRQRRERALAFRARLRSRVGAVCARLGLGDAPARAVAAALSAAGDYGRSVVLCSLLGFQLLHWWYTTGEAAVESGSRTRKRIPPPPPPPPPRYRPGRELRGAGPLGAAAEEEDSGPGAVVMSSVDDVIASVRRKPGAGGGGGGGEEEGVPFAVPLAEDAAACPLCSAPQRNPCTITVSGYCFCYACALGYVRRHGRCPVSLLECGESHIRRLHL